MKNLYLIFFFASLLQSSFAQDSIVFKDGRIKNVKIIEVQETQQVIVYQLKKDTISTKLTEIADYKLNGKWQVPDAAGNLNQNGDRSQFKMYKSFFREPSKYTYSRYSVSTCLSAPIFFDNDYENLHLFAPHLKATFEPEIRLTKKLSIKIPIVIGLKKTVYPYSIFESEEYYHDNSLIFGNVGSNDWLYKYEYSHQQIPTIRDRGYGSDGHSRNLIFQVGISPKFYPFGQTKQALYISQSFNLGIHDYNSVDYYAEFDTTSITEIDYSTWPYQQVTKETWQLISENSISNKNPFVYFRYEALIGFSFNWGKSFCASIETGYSTKMTKNTGRADNVYIKVPGSDYELVYSEVYNDPFTYGARFGYFINRVHLVYRFGGKRIVPKN